MRVRTSVSLKRQVSCGTIPIKARTEAWVRVRTSRLFVVWGFGSVSKGEKGDEEHVLSTMCKRMTNLVYIAHRNKDTHPITTLDGHMSPADRP